MLVHVVAAARIISLSVSNSQVFTSPDRSVLTLVVIFAISLVISKFYLILGTAVKEQKELAHKVGISLGILQLFSLGMKIIISAYMFWDLTKGWSE